MKLHLDENAFKVLIANISNDIGIRADIIEKDYYVTLMLNELAEKQKNINAYFKGGTALYKALKSIRRFSEDIDITLDTTGLTKTQKNKQLKNISKHYECLSVLKEKTKDCKDSIECTYSYSSKFSFDEDDALQRFERVKIEATSFTISEPMCSMSISPIVYDYSNESTRQILKDQFDVEPFEIKTITLPRIFVDKIFAAEYYYEHNEYFDVAKHLYDITVLLKIENITNIINNKDELQRLVLIKRQEEKNRYGSKLSEMKIKEFEYFSTINDNKEFAKSFEKMQRQYVFRKEDELSIRDIYESINNIKSTALIEL